MTTAAQAKNTQQRSQMRMPPSVYSKLRVRVASQIHCVHITFPRTRKCAPKFTVYITRDFGKYRLESTERTAVHVQGTF